MVVESAGRAFAHAGAHVFGAHPDLRLADDTFRTLRAWSFWARFGRCWPSGRTPSSRRWPTTSGPAGRSPEPTSPAPMPSARPSPRRCASSSARYDVLLLPVSQVPPFPADQEYPTAINGRPMETYLDWMRSAYLITVTGCPAISVPAGTTPSGLPVGLQIVAPHGADRFLLEVAAAFEAAATSSGGSAPT